jgi:hypothetical protein
MSKKLLSAMQRHVAQLAANGSSLRNQGAAGVVAVARDFLEHVELRRFVRGGERAFNSELDHVTELLCGRFPEKARNWGAARKVLNLFLRDCLYHRYLAEAYGLDRLQEWLEVPLDSQVAEALLKALPDLTLPAWPGIKRLTRSQSAQYQEAAVLAAEALQVARIDLDLWYWRPQ